MYPNEKVISRMQVHRVVKKFEETGSVLDQRHNNQGRPRTARSSENVGEIKDVITDTPQRSVRRVLSDITNDCSVITVYRTI